MELKGDRLFLVIGDVDIANIPDPFTSWFEGQADGPIEEGLDELDLEPHTYTVTLSEGSVTIEGVP
ncbi:MAG: hypothetical protein IIC91_09335 [Chloroflexi bacterium]|nr:hypothetical protein [Chloroflexota bacterium]